ncbi:metallophosphoesterase [Granulicella sp. WH15]|uniref:metallophosphoesterase family protein n=1 Tax=Granulicella sp. WH15 TaxID=2602070 RepID=UPI001366E83A|nr:metallophosphoesterase [Granulicella sp. WH15]QHN02485.1 metallophosphoesterase [Granulicella sp. WH15]
MPSSFNRRQFLSLLGAGAAAAALPSSALAFAAPKQEDFSFLFLTDSHLQPELRGVDGTTMAFKHARSLRADFAIQGGDHIFDALGTPKATVLQNYSLYDKAEQDLGLKVHHTLGNHDVLGIYPSGGVPPTDPLYGKKLFADRFGPTWYSFDHKGHHFIVLDSIGITDDHHYQGRIDADQMQWLANDLAATPAGTPIIVTTHIPLVTAMNSYTPPAPQSSPSGFTFVNGPEAIKLFEGHNVLGVLQGHTHINEQVVWHGVPYITSGAVCGNWWHGTRMGTPEGFTVVSVANGRLTTRYETYGFKSVEPQNT